MFIVDLVNVMNHVLDAIAPSVAAGFQKQNEEESQQTVFTVNSAGKTDDQDITTEEQQSDETKEKVTISYILFNLYCLTEGKNMVNFMFTFVSLFRQVELMNELTQILYDTTKNLTKGLAIGQKQKIQTPTIEMQVYLNKIYYCQ